VKQNADNAREADELARSAAKRAEQGGAEVVKVVLTMSDISDSARRIADIITVIDGIAFQTNILALNAAVEAARAGEQGRGFAVVASEVRALAQRSADAAKEIKQLIAASVQKVEAGTHIVEQAGDTIQALVVDVQRVSGLMRSIAEASAEQSRGVQQVNRTVTEMDKVVQQNASVVQESSAAAESLKRQAGLLVDAVGTFRIALDERVPGGATEHWQDRLAPVPAKALPNQPTRPGATTRGPDGEDWTEF
jgi:methyl-accepting chemotaxis protein